MAAAVQRLAAAGMPVVTLVTDVPGSERLAYVGIDNRAPGRPPPTRRAVARRRDRRRAGDAQPQLFRGEEEREMGFRSDAAGLSRRGPSSRSPTATDSTRPRVVRGALDVHPDIERRLLDRRRQHGDRSRRSPRWAECRVFIAHDLDGDNTRLLRAGRISAVLHHDLNQDMRRACHIIMQAHRALPGRHPVVAVEHPGGDAVQHAANRPRPSTDGFRAHAGLLLDGTTPEVLPCPPHDRSPNGAPCSGEAVRVRSGCGEGLLRRLARVATGGAEPRVRRLHELHLRRRARSPGSCATTAARARRTSGPPTSP